MLTQSPVNAKSRMVGGFTLVFALFSFWVMFLVISAPMKFKFLMHARFIDLEKRGKLSGQLLHWFGGGSRLHTNAQHLKSVVACRQLVAQHLKTVVVCRQIVAQDLKAVVDSRQIVAQDLMTVVACRQIIAHLKTVVACRQIVAQHLKTVVASRQILAHDLKAVVTSRQIVAQDLMTDK